MVLASMLTPVPLTLNLHVSAWLCVRLKKKNPYYGRATVKGKYITLIGPLIFNLKIQ